MANRAHGRRSLPQIFINDQHIGGCDDLHALERKGQLDSLLQPSASL
jgi:glutaredoxin 3